MAGIFQAPGTLSMADLRVLFVCLGNICRSPTAQGIFQHCLASHPLAQRVYVDSAGTGSWHAGKPPDARAIAAAAKHGCDISGLRARQVLAEDFYAFDYILAMDAENLRHLKAMCPADFAGTLCRFLDFADGQGDVPDPYYGGDDGFEHVYTLCEQASRGLLNHLVDQHG